MLKTAKYPARVDNPFSEEIKYTPHQQLQEKELDNTGNILGLEDLSDSDEEEITNANLTPRSKLRREFEKESKRERKLTHVLEKNFKFCEKAIGRAKLEEILKHLITVVQADKEPDNEDILDFGGGYGGIFKNVQP